MTNPYPDALQMGNYKLNDRRIINGWAFFDWANSSYALVISAAIFPAYFIRVTDEVVHVGGMTLTNSALYAYTLSASYLLLTLVTPALSGIADAGGKRMGFLKMFTTIGSVSCLLLFFFRGMEQLWLGTLAFMTATIGFAGGLVFYNSYLPHIATEDRYDAVSARGFAYGYIGSVLLLIINVLVIMNPGWFGIDAGSGLAVRIAFVTVGLWWIGFAQIPFHRLPPDEANGTLSASLLSRGFVELRKAWNSVREQVNIRRFLLAFFFYNGGVQTVLYLAATFAEKELHFATGELILIILLLQIVAVAGAWAFARVSGIKGNKFTIILMLVCWIVVCGLAYLVKTQSEFYVVAAMVGTVMGGIQSLSRSTYSKLLPENTPDTTTYFSFYDILDKLSTVLGTFCFGFVEHITGGIRNSVIALALLFVAGLFFVIRLQVKRPDPVAAS